MTADEAGQSPDTPALTYGGDRLPPAVSPDGVVVDHDCDFRRMLREIAVMLGVDALPSGNFDAHAVEDALRAALAAPEVDTAAPIAHIGYTVDLLAEVLRQDPEDAPVVALAADPDLLESLSRAARSSLGVCDSCDGDGSRRLRYDETDVGPEDCGHCDGTGWSDVRAALAARTSQPSEPYDWRVSNPAHAPFCDGSCDAGRTPCPQTSAPRAGEPTIAERARARGVEPRPIEDVIADHGSTSGPVTGGPS